jgi:hypothetical protein
MEDQIRLFSVCNSTSKRILVESSTHREKKIKRIEKLSTFGVIKMIIDAFYFVVSKSDFVSLKLI